MNLGSTFANAGTNMVNYNAKSTFVEGETHYSKVVPDVKYESASEIQTFEVADLIRRT